MGRQCGTRYPSINITDSRCPAKSKCLRLGTDQDFRLGPQMRELLDGTVLQRERRMAKKPKKGKPEPTTPPPITIQSEATGRANKYTELDDREKELFDAWRQRVASGENPIAFTRQMGD